MYRQVMAKLRSVPRSTDRATSMTRRARTLLMALPLCTFLFLTTTAWATETLTVHARFTPDQLGASTNLSLTASFTSSAGGPPSPVTRLALYAPAGITVDAQGAGTCMAATLEKKGPSGCPPNSRAGFGGGVGVLELPTGAIREPYTLDFFFGPRSNGHLVLLAYASAVAPATVELVVVAREVPAPKPYGLGFVVEVPPITTFPGVPYASIESVFATFGAANVAYYENVHGKRKLVHIRGMVVPKKCPAGGFATEGIVGFANGSTLTVNPTIPCPHD
jgi:hypothetical protein